MSSDYFFFDLFIVTDLRKVAFQFDRAPNFARFKPTSKLCKQWKSAN